MYLNDARKYALYAVMTLAIAESGSLGRADDIDLNRPATPPAVAVKQFKIADGLSVSLYAAEPDVAQPVSISIDDRGRMWVVQYLQYPHPAGLKPVQVDQYLRTKYDRVPEPPPKGPRGADRITIFEDTNGDGVPDRHKDFVSGLNLCSGLALGHDGAFVLQTPYLLFYPDRDHDDVPDGDPEVLLSGFGMEDAHAVASSLTWGPDGWLYGVQGSTVTANIRGIEFQQGVWRYHPLTKRFELFSEGGGNNFGFDFDRFGNAFAAGNEVEPMCHHVQGGYYIKGFSKHGPLHNPYTYGYFQPTPHYGYLGDSLSGGFVFYFADALPPQFRGACIAPHTRHSASRWSRVERLGSTFETHDGGNFLSSPDQGFRPVDMTVGPDGAVYVADWYDLNISHSDPRDRSKYYPPRVGDGRVWKVTATGAKGSIFSGPPLRDRSTDELIDLLHSSNDWYARGARVILAERKDRSALARLRELVFKEESQELSLQALWAYYVTAGLDDDFAEKLLDHRFEYVRAWTIRLLGDERRIPERLFPHLVRLSREDASAVVHSQLASTAKRLPGEQALPLLAELVQHDGDMKDPFIPLLIWWAFEDKAVPYREQVLRLATREDARVHPLIRDVVASRLVRRYTAEGGDLGFASCEQLLAAASPEQVDALLAAMDEELAGRTLAQMPPALKNRLDALMNAPGASNLHIRLALRLNQPNAVPRALEVMMNAAAAEADRLQLISALGESKREEGVDALLELAEKETSPAIGSAVLQALGRFNQPQIGDAVIRLFRRWPPLQQQQACDALCSRPAWTLALLRAVDRGELSKTTLSPEQLHRVQLHKNVEIDALLEKHWGKIGPSSTAETQKRIDEIVGLVNTTPGTPAAGKQVFANTCGKCHQLFGEGTSIGPDLTGVERRRLDVLAANIVEPSSVIRPEYQNYVVVTADGLVLAGLMADSSPKTITLADAQNKRTTLDRDEIEQIEPSKISLMPEKLLDSLSPQQIADLVAYLRSDQPK